MYCFPKYVQVRMKHNHYLTFLSSFKSKSGDPSLSAGDDDSDNLYSFDKKVIVIRH